MAEKNFNTRISHKYDTLENWTKASNFVPLQGELIIFSGDEEYNAPRIKVGDGKSTLKNLNYFYEGTTLFDLDYICKNQVPKSIDLDGSIYNETGYKDGYRVRSGGAEAETWAGSCTGYIKVNPKDRIYITGCDFNRTSVENAINVFNSSFVNLGQLTMQPASYDIFASYETGGAEAYGPSSVSQESEKVWSWVVPPAEFEIAYIRVTGYTSGDGSNLIVTINNPISVESATLINFTINDASYSAEQGMTWREWVNSQYNIDGYIISGYVMTSTRAIVMRASDVYVNADDIIDPTIKYSYGAAEPT